MTSSESLVYPLKKIKFPSPIDPEGYDTFHILMQNENGPCPLIAIANVLSLRREINLIEESSSGSTGSYCSNERVLSLVLDKIVTVSEQEKGASY